MFDAIPNVQDVISEVVASSARVAGVDAPLELSWSEVFTEDWEEQIRASYVPVQLTEDLWIIPEWSGSL